MLRTWQVFTKISSKLYRTNATQQIYAIDKINTLNSSLHTSVNKQYSCVGRKGAFVSGFAKKTLPSKNIIREKNRKLLGAAMIDTWMRKKESSSKLSQSLFGT